MPFATVMGLPKEVKSVLPLLAQQVFMKAFNADYKTTEDDTKASAAAWKAVRAAGFRKAVSGRWAMFMDESEVQFGSCKGMEIFSTGKHTASNGQKVDISMDDLKEICDFSNELVQKGEHHAPIKQGHVKDKEGRLINGLPALGWAEKYYIKGQKLVADIIDIPNKLVDGINHKSWRKRSIELYPNYMQSGLRAVKAIALLGAEAPALKGLNDVVAQYGEVETEDVLSFETESIENYKEEMKELEEKNKELKKQLEHSELEMEELKNKNEEGQTMPLNEKEIAAKETQLKKDQIAFDEKQEAQKKIDDDNAKKQKDFEERRTAEAATKFEADVDGIIKEFKEGGQLLPSQEGEYKSFAMGYGENKVIKFGEAGKEVDTPVLDVLRSMLEKNVKQVDFAEKGTEGDGGKETDDSKFAEFEKKVKELRKENKDLSYSEAVKEVGEAEPELYEEYCEEAAEEGDTSGKGETESKAIKK